MWQCRSSQLPVRVNEIAHFLFLVLDNPREMKWTTVVIGGGFGADKGLAATAIKGEN